MPTQFDSFSATYEDGLQQGLQATGESKDYFARGRIQWLQNRLAAMREQPSRILDFGCGTGTSIPLLLSLPGATEAVAVDVSEESLKIAKENADPAARITFSTPDKLPPGANIDLAFCNGVFHHIPPENRPAAVRYILDSLRPGGLFALFENNPWNPGTRYVMSRIPFDRDAITLSAPQSRALCISAGFEIITTRFLFLFPKFLGWLRWIEPALAGIPLGGQYIVLCRKPMEPSAR